jgi:mRNA interferase RelE/StbE
VATYSVMIMPRAERQLKALPKSEAKKVARKLLTLSGDPPPKESEKLSQAPCFRRIRAGDYRVVYLIDDAALVVAVALVRHRKDAYRDLDKLDPTVIQEIIQTRLASLR